MIKKPTLLFLITKSNWGGAQRYVYEMATAMRVDYDVSVGSGGTGTMRDKLEAANIQTYTVAGWQRNINPLKELRSWWSLYRLLRSVRPDVLHLNSSKAGLSGAVVGRIAGVKNIVFTVHGWPFLEPRPPWWRALTWLGMYVTALFVHTLIPISHYDIAHAHMPGVKRKFAPVVHNAVPEITFLPQREARAALLGADVAEANTAAAWLLTIAELHPKKNIATAIKAVAAHNDTYPDTPIFYLVIGDGVLKQALQTLVENKDAAKYIQLLGHVTDARQYLGAADMFLLPSYQEGLPYALLEAGAAGLPTIASDVCGIPEVITHEQNGLLFDPHNQATLEQALGQYTQHPDQRKQLGEAFRETIETNFTLREMTQKTMAAYSHRR